MITFLFVSFLLWKYEVNCLQASDFYVHELPLLPKDISIHMHAGHLPINPEHHGALFFWHFASKHTADKSRTVIWLNGGPGCSSLIGAWMEIGPFRFQDENTMIENNGSWHLFTNLLFVDQPVGTGFSYIDTDYLLHELDEMANQFLGFLDRYLDIFPELRLHDIYLAGESFAGQYIPYVAQAILVKRSALKLCGLLIGNGWIDPLATYQSYLPFATAHNLVKIDSALHADISSQVKTCELAYSNHAHILEKECDSILEKIFRYGAMNDHYPEHQNGRCVNVYDVRLDDTSPSCGRNWPPDLVYVRGYLHRKDVMSQIHLNNKKSDWTECSDPVFETFRACHSKPAVQLLPRLLQQIPIVLYNGDYDLICNHWGAERMLDALTWNNGTGFALDNGTVAPMEPWIVENELAGLIRTARNLTYIRFYNASHMVPYNQALRSRAMLHQFMNLNLNFVTYPTTEKNIELSTQIIHRTSKRTAFIALIITIIVICAGSILVFLYKRRQPTPFSIVRICRSNDYNLEPKQLLLYSVLQDSNEFFSATDNETSL